MNQTLLQFAIEQEKVIGNYKNTEDTNNLISGISLAICSILLSLTGFMVAVHKSRCKTINCCGLLKCNRIVDEEK